MFDTCASSRLSPLRRLRLALIALTVTLAGCASEPRDQRESAAESIASITSGAPRDERVTRLLPGINAGLELHRLVLAYPFDDIRSALRPYLEVDDVVPAEKREQLRRHGLRVVAVPIEDMPDVLGQLDRQPVIDSAWMGQLSEWTSIAEGPEVRGSMLVDLGGSSAPFAEGRFRLLVRSYVLTTESARFLRLEMVPQFHQPRPDPFVPSRSAVNLMGQFIAEAALALELDGTHVLFLTAEDPVVTWGGESDDAKSADEGDGDAEPEDSAEAAATPAYGPTGGEIRTVGEEVLEGEGGNRRALLIFVPYVRRQ